MTIEGIIRPPTDIRAVADKTASFVSKNGRAFEQRILNSEKGQTPKFSFLHENSPFHAYYEDRIIFYQDGGDEKEKEEKKKLEEKKGEEKKEDERAALIKKSAKQEIKSALDPVAKALLDQRNKIKKQHNEIEKMDRDRKEDDKEEGGSLENQPLTVATGIMVTQPPPLHFINITAPRILTAEEVETIKLVAQFTAFDSSKNFLQNLTIREWNNPSFAFLQPRNAQFAYFSALTDCYKYIIDTFINGDEMKALSVEDCINLAAYRAEYEQYAEERQLNNGSDEDDANAIDWHDFIVVEMIDFPKDETVEPPALPSEPDIAEESDDEEELRVVPNYTPKVFASNQSNISQTNVIDPITGKSVPVSDFSEHLRIQSLDPKWAEEKKKFQEKQKESNLVTGETMATYLSQVVGNTSDTSDLHGDAKRRLEEANRVIQENGQQPPGPMLQPVEEPLTKRPRIDQHLMMMLPPPPPAFPPMEGMPPPPPVHIAMPPPPPVFPAYGLPPPPPPMLGVEIAPPIVPGAPMIPNMEELLDEDEFKASLDSTTVTLEISIPKDTTNSWNFNGQTESLQVDVMTKIKAVKEKLSDEHLNKVNTNKLQLRHSALAFLKDTMSLAELNLGGVVSLELIPKTRGRSKK